MINNIEFADRLRIIMDYYQLSASAFSDRIQVQRSSISHLLSGRNKPSLDFVMRVIKEFDEVELYWLLNGKGQFPHSDEPEKEEQEVSSTLSLEPQEDSAGNQLEKNISDDPIKIFDKKKIERIVIFYKDGSFRAYTP